MPPFVEIRLDRELKSAMTEEVELVVLTALFNQIGDAMMISTKSQNVKSFVEMG
jgi:hypothetical protein